MVLGSRGQAALADAIFLLVIVSGLAALMFFFTTDYGVAIDRTAIEFYGTDYATSALQTVLYSSTPRHETETLENAMEVDYLLAFLKEDYANDREFDDSSKNLLLKDITTVMASSIPSHDFIFLMRTLPIKSGSLSEFVFVLIKYTDFTDPANPKHVYYFCEPTVGKEYLIEEELLARAGRVVKAQPVILRFKIAGTAETERIFTTLNMWPSVELPKTELIEKPDKLNCSEAP